MQNIPQGLSKTPGRRAKYVDYIKHQPIILLYKKNKGKTV